MYVVINSLFSLKYFLMKQSVLRDWRYGKFKCDEFAREKKRNTQISLLKMVVYYEFIPIYVVIFCVHISCKTF